MVRKKQVTQLMDEVSLEDSFLMGYYGGGNFGDELLFEVLQHMMRSRGIKRTAVLYQRPGDYAIFHRDLGYTAVDSANKLEVLKAIWRQKTLVVGGGGLWGLDVNLNVVLMSVMLFIARMLLGKDVYLLGVGYYGSTNRMGHFAAWLAGKSATQILARDEESYQRFVLTNKQTYLCDDIAFSLPELDEVGLKRELEIFEKSLLPLTKPTTFISVRRFKSHQSNSYQKSIESWLMHNPDHPVIMALMEPRSVDPEGYALLKQWQRARPNMKVIDFDYNPILLYRFFKRHHAMLSYIGPQFHVLLVAYLAGVRLLPIAYDNKVIALLEKTPYDDPIPIREVSEQHIQQFVRAGIH